jgi:CubicO group peptidase (beta-lactamase class C family)
MPILREVLVASMLSAVVLAASGCATPARDAISPHTAIAMDLGMPTASPESQGFTTGGLDALTKEFRDLVDQQKLAGVTTLLAHHGKVVHFDTYGKASTASGDTLKPDSIFRIASMTKPIVGVAMMQLWEQGKWKLDDPVSKFIPEFANLQVKKAGGGTEPQARPMIMAQLMSHSAGFGVSAVYEKDNLQGGNLQDMIDKLAKLPLETQPGSAWDYGPSVNIQGYLVEKFSGQTLDVYLQQHVFGPLGMEDTGFWVPDTKKSRVVAIHTYDAQGRITTSGENRVGTSRPAFLSGSGGLLSTAEDYWHFAQAVGNGGELDGKRILKADTIRLMRTNVLKTGVKVDLYGPSQDGVGFGMDFAVIMDPKLAGTPQGLNSFYWGGAFGTWFWIDPTNDLVFVGMIQNLNGSNPAQGTPATRVISPKLTYEALKSPTK